MAHPVDAALAPGFGLGLAAGVMCWLVKANWGVSKQLTNLYKVNLYGCSWEMALKPEYLSLRIPLELCFRITCFPSNLTLSKGREEKVLQRCGFGVSWCPAAKPGWKVDAKKAE